MVLSTSKPIRETMANVDAAWLRMDRPTNLMMITTVMTFRQRLHFGRLKKALSTRFLKFDRFKQYPVIKNDATYWETDPNFDLESHVHRMRLAGAGGKMELQELVSDLISTALDTTKPRWRFDLIEDYQGGSALIVRIHHCYADGIALTGVLLSVTNASGEEDRPTSDDTSEAGILHRLYAPAVDMVDNLVGVGERVLDETIHLMRHPTAALDYFRQGTEIAAELAKLIMLPDDPITRLKGQLGVRKRVAWAEPLSLDEVKAISKALNCTVNDILMSCVAGAIRAYLSEKGDDVDDLAIKVIIPINLRPLEEFEQLGNRFGLVFLELPLGVRHPLERLYEVKKNMKALKGSKQAIATYGLLEALGMAPGRFEQQAIELLSTKATAVMTNVPGPQDPIDLADATIDEIMFWVPQSGDLGVGVSIFSYAGQVQFGLITDKKIVDDPHNIVNRFAGEFEKLVLITLMGPFGKETIG